jgi:hypothetical protein
MGSASQKTLATLLSWATNALQNLPRITVFSLSSERTTLQLVRGFHGRRG